MQPDRSFNDTDPMMSTPVSEPGGEGNREADRVYRDGVAKTLATKDVNALADKAKKALDGPEGPTLRAAEKEGKSRAAKPAAKASPVFPKKQRQH